LNGLIQSQKYGQDLFIFGTMFSVFLFDSRLSAPEQTHPALEHSQLELYACMVVPFKRVGAHAPDAFHTHGQTDGGIVFEIRDATE
jgi:hypothetical protein